MLAPIVRRLLASASSGGTMRQYNVNGVPVMDRSVAAGVSAQDQTTLAALPFSTAPAAVEQLHITVVFHPDPVLWDARCLLPLDTLRRGLSLGRLQPLFLTQAGDRSLADPYVSRAAVTLRWSTDGLMVEPQGTAGLRCGGAGLMEPGLWSATALRRGIPLLLAERVVLCLQLAPPLDASRPIPGLLGESPAMQTLRQQLVRLAAQPADVLLRGETGTGKERVAAALHQLSSRCSGPLLRINMAAIPEALAATELFGVRRGSHSAATRDAPGYFQRAAGGTLFLDEVGATPVAVQAQLLRALENREIQPVGGQPVGVDLRVISATDADLDCALDFSAALRHRLGALELTLPTLTERRSDIGLLLRYFLSEAGALSTLSADSEQAVSLWAREYERCLLADWPGNVRQLRNHATQLAALGVESAGFPTLALTSDIAAAPAMGASDSAVLATLEACHYDVAKAARALGLSRQAIYRFIERSPALRKAADIPRDELLACYEEAQGDPSLMARRCRVSMAALLRRLRTEGLIA